MRKLSSFLVVLFVCLSFGCVTKDVDNKKTSKIEKDAPEIIDISDNINEDKENLKVVQNGINGVFNPLYAITRADKSISSLQFLPLLFKDRNLSYITNNSISRDYNVVNGNLRFKLRDINWWDGNPVVSEDILFSLKLLLRSDYVGDERSALLFNIVGAKDFYEGKSEDISGFRVLDDKTFLIRLIDDNIKMEEALTFRPIPSHYYGAEEDVHILDDKPLGNGSYKLYDYEKKNFCILRANRDFYYNTPNIPSIIIREEMLQDVKTELYNGEVDIVDVYGNNAIRFDSNIRDEYNIYTIYENNSTLLMCVPSGDLRSLNLRKYIFSLINENDFTTKTYKLFKYDEGLLSLSNRYYSNIEIPYNNRLPIELSLINGKLYKNGREFNLDFYYSNIGLNEYIASKIKEKLEKSGIGVNLIEKSPYEIVKYVSSSREEMKNAIVLHNFRNGTIPDFTNLYNGREFMGEPQENRFKSYVSLYKEKSVEERIVRIRRNSLDLINKAWVRGIGSPIARIYLRRSIRYVFQNEYLNWFEGDVWNISWQ